jgi:hypothetical protein
VRGFGDLETVIMHMVPAVYRSAIFEVALALAAITAALAVTTG